MLWALFGLQSGWSRQELGSPFLLCDMCQASRGMGKDSRSMPFAIPMVWREPTDHVSDCYFCLTSITSVTAKSKHTVQYPNLPSAMRPVHHSAELPLPKPPTNMALSDSVSRDEDVGQANNNMDCDPTFAGASSSNEPHLLTQGDLNDIIRDLNLSKKQAKLLGSRLKGWNLLRQDTKVCFYLGRHEEFNYFFSQENSVIFFNDVCSIMEVLGHEFNPDQWCLYIDSSNVSLKVVLLHNGNKFPPFLWLMQPTRRKIMKVWRCCWERLSVTNLSGSYVVISRLWRCYSECNSGTQNTVISCVSCTAGTRRITM